MQLAKIFLVALADGMPNFDWKMPDKNAQPRVIKPVVYNPRIATDPQMQRPYKPPGYKPYQGRNWGFNTRMCTLYRNCTPPHLRIKYARLSRAILQSRLQ